MNLYITYNWQRKTKSVEMIWKKYRCYKINGWKNCIKRSKNYFFLSSFHFDKIISNKNLEMQRHNHIPLLLVHILNAHIRTHLSIVFIICWIGAMRCGAFVRSVKTADSYCQKKFIVPIYISHCCCMSKLNFSSLSLPHFFAITEHTVVSIFLINGYFVICYLHNFLSITKKNTIPCWLLLSSCILFNIKRNRYWISTWNWLNMYGS